MKKFVLLIALFAFTCAFAQAPLGMVKVDAPTDQQLQADAYSAYVAARTSNNEVRTVPGVLTREPAKNNVLTNHEELPVLLKEFYDGAIYYKVNYGPQLSNLKHVMFVDTENYGFLGDVSKDGTTIRLNSSLLAYPNLTRVIFLQTMGKAFGLKYSTKHNHEIMSSHWEIDVKHEILARNTRSRPWQRENFFKLLADEKPLNKRL